MDSYYKSSISIVRRLRSTLLNLFASHSGSSLRFHDSLFLFLTDFKKVVDSKFDL